MPTTDLPAALAGRPWFIAGASGYTGRAMVAALRASGLPVIAHLRPGSGQRAQLAPAWEALGATVDETPWDAAAMTARFVDLGPAVVFGLLGTTRARAAAEAKAGQQASTYEAVDRDLTLLLLRAAAAAPARPRPLFVYLSSLGADRPGGNRYLQARHRVEAELRVGDLPHLIARPSFITGPDRAEDRPGERIGAAVADRALGILGALGARQTADRYRSIDADGLARALRALSLEELRRAAAQPDPAVPSGRTVQGEDLQAAAR
jgi:uncharacterized protein YbjT (DUF2867 family)